MASLLNEIARQGLLRAVVIASELELMIAFDDDLNDVMPADLLQTTEGPSLRLDPGDVVVACRLGEESGRAVVIGRIASQTAAALPATQHTPADRDDLPDTLVIEARESLTLRVGDGSITIRADGRILIKGKDLVSHAQRLNRIKGGSVAIN
jgi:hypothetical protein